MSSRSTGCPGNPRIFLSIWTWIYCLFLLHLTHSWNWGFCELLSPKVWNLPHQNPNLLKLQLIPEFTIKGSNTIFSIFKFELDGQWQRIRTQLGNFKQKPKFPSGTNFHFFWLVFEIFNLERFQLKRPQIYSSSRKLTFWKTSWLTHSKSS